MGVRRFSRDLVPAGADFDAVIIGSGLGGLTAAAFLAQAGLRVLVCERHDRPGGFGHSWTRKPRISGRRAPISFDASVHDVSGAYAGGPVRLLLDRLGVGADIEWRRVAHRYIVPDLVFDIPADIEDFERALCRLFPCDASAVARLFRVMKQCDAELKAIARYTNGIPRPPVTPQEMQRFAQVCPVISSLIGVSYADVLGPGMDPALRQLLSLIGSYTMENAAEASFLNMMPLFSYYIHGGYYPRGGMQGIADALCDVIRRQGGAVLLRCPVVEIAFTEDAVSGVVTAQGAFRTRRAVSNADIAQTLALLPKALGLRPIAARRLQAVRPSNSAAMVYLVLDRDPGICGCTIISDPELGGVILSFPPFPQDRAPAGLFTLTMTALIGTDEARHWNSRPADYGVSKSRQGDRMIAIAAKYIHNLPELIVFREDGTPATMARYIGTTNGAAYGTSPDTRWPGSQMPVRGLYVVGACVGLGPGIEAVMIGGASLAEQLLHSLESV